MKLKDAIIELLKSSKKPMHRNELARIIRQKKMATFLNDHSVGSAVYGSIKEDPETPFVQTAPATFALRDDVLFTESVTEQPRPPVKAVRRRQRAIQIKSETRGLVLRFYVENGEICVEAL